MNKLNLSDSHDGGEAWREAIFPYARFTRAIQRALAGLNVETIGEFLQVDWGHVYSRGLGNSKREYLLSLVAEITENPTEWLAQGVGQVDVPTDSPLDLQRWPEELLSVQLPLEVLSTKARNVLLRNDIDTVGAFLERDWPRLILSQMGDKTRNELCEWRFEMGNTPEEVQTWVNEHSSQKENFSAFLPTQDIIDQMGRPLNFLQLWPQILEEVLEPRRYEIIKRRNGLNGSAEYSLEKLGQAEGVSRERIRQIEGVAERDLVHFLKGELTRTLKNQLHPEMQTELSALMSLLEESIFPLTEGELWPLLNERYMAEATVEEKIAFRFFLRLKGYFPQTAQSLELPNTVGHLWFASNADRKFSGHVFKALGRSLRDQVEPKELFAIRLEVIESIRAESEGRQNLPDLRRFIELWGQAEEVAPETNFFQTRFQFLESNISRVERVMREWAIQDKFVASVEELTREVNHRHALYSHAESLKTTNRQAVGNACISSTNLTNIGRSGGWSLVENAGETRPFFEIMKECLLKLNRPATGTEVFDYVSQKRACSHQSLVCIMNERPDFRRVGHGLYALTSWNLPAAPSRRLGDEQQQEFDDMLLDLFAESDEQPIPHADLVAKMHPYFGGHINTIRRRLERSPYIELQTLENGRVMASWLHDPKEESLEERAVRQGKRGQVRQHAQEILSKAPNKEMPGALLTRIIEAQTGFYRPQIYNSLQNAPQIERVVDGRSVRYKLK